MYYKRLNLFLFNGPIIFSVVLSIKGDFLNLILLTLMSFIVISVYQPFKVLIKEDRFFILKYFSPAFGGVGVFFILHYLGLDKDWSLLYYFCFVVFYLKFLMRNSKMMLKEASTKETSGVT